MAIQPAPTSAAGVVLPAFEDGLGRRYRPAARGEQAPPEILCFRPELTDVPAFEFSLRERVARLVEFRHPEYARIRKVDRLSDERGTVVLMSDSISGVRLSQLLAAADEGRAVLTLDAALCLVRQLIPAMTLLHRQAGVAHGAMAPERLLVTPQGKLIVLEYATGAALEQLRYSRERYWKELRVALPKSVGAPRFDEVADLTQMGIVTLSLILGRNLRDDEFPTLAGDLINSAAARSADGRCDSLPSGLREWLRRALDVDARHSFKSLAEAQNAFDKLASVEAIDDADVRELQNFLDNYRNPPAQKPVAAKSSVLAAVLPPPRVMEPEAEFQSEKEAPMARRAPRRPMDPVLKQRAWIAAGVLGAVVVGGVLYATQSGSLPSAPPTPPTPAGVMAIAAPGAQPMELPVAAVTPVLASTPPPLAAGQAPADLPAAKVDTGWLSVSAPFDMDLYEQGRLLGSTGIDRIMLPAGKHDIEIVNEALGYREPRTLTVVPNKVASLAVSLPKGTISVNAIPWATVSIDGENAGDTPIGNLSLTIGPHEVVFTNPQLGEQRRVITVTQRSPVRLSIDLTKK